jgi:DNA invertase Pin-like site-specific DNA recombinase
MTAYGYARVSTDGQTLAAQDAALRAAGCAKGFAEKISGASTDGRKALAQALRALGPGDVLVVTRLDGWRDRHAICSTHSTRSAKPVRTSEALRMRGPTQPPRTAG